MAFLSTPVIDELYSGEEIRKPSLAAISALSRVAFSGRPSAASRSWSKSGSGRSARSTIVTSAPASRAPSAATRISLLLNESRRVLPAKARILIVRLIGALRGVGESAGRGVRTTERAAPRAGGRSLPRCPAVDPLGEAVESQPGDRAAMVARSAPAKASGASSADAGASSARVARRRERNASCRPASEPRRQRASTAQRQPGHPLEPPVERLQVGELGQQCHRGLLADAPDSGDVVHRIAGQSQKVGDLRGADAELAPHALGRRSARRGRSRAGSPGHPPAGRGPCPSSPPRTVAGGDQAPAHRADEVVGLVAPVDEGGGAKRRRQLAAVVELRLELGRRQLSLRLVGRVDLVAKAGGQAAVEGDGQVAGRLRPGSA